MKRVEFHNKELDALTLAVPNVTGAYGFLLTGTYGSVAKGFASDKYSDVDYYVPTMLSALQAQQILFKSQEHFEKKVAMEEIDLKLAKCSYPGGYIDRQFKLVAMKYWLVGYREGIGPTLHYRTAYELLDASTNKTIGFISAVCALNSDTVEILNDLKRKQGVQEFKTFEDAVTAAGINPQSQCVRAARELIDNSIDYESLFLSKSERGFYVSLNINIDEIVVTYNLPLGNTAL